MNWFSNKGSLAELAEECKGAGEDGKYVVPPEFPKESELLFGDWDEESYEGSFYLLWRRDGALYEMKMSHCSCNYYGEDFGSWARNQPLSREYLQMRERPYWSGQPAKAVAWDAVLETA